MIDTDYTMAGWMARYLKISTLEGDITPLYLNKAQVLVDNTLNKQREAGVPMRVIVLKARREGVSTYSEARFFYEINRKKNRCACICSADKDASDKVFKMAKLFQEMLPEKLKKPTDYSNRKEIVYSAPHRSEFVVQTAGKDILGRGGNVHYLHATEFAFWSDAKTQFGGAVQEVPDSQDSIVIIESTANGIGGAFYDMYMEAMHDYDETGDIRNYIPIFLPWYIFDKNQIFDVEIEVGKPSPGVEAAWVEAEEELSQRYYCSNTQLAWRRWAIKNKCQNDLSLFKQEYPASVQEAFQSTGRPVFSHSMLDRQQKVAAREGRYCHFVDDEIRNTNATFNCWKVCRQRSAGHQYVIGVDPMEGKLLDQSDPKSKGDRHGVVIFDRNDMCNVAIYHGSGPQKELALEVFEAAKYYNNAWVCPEINCGMEFLSRLKDTGYQNIYSRQKGNEKFDEEDSDLLGWRTTIASRKWLVDRFITVVNDNYTILFPEIINEMRTFIYDKMGKPVHATGKWDDLLFGAMLAVTAHLDCPLERGVYYADRTDYANRPRIITNLSMSGAIDPGICFEEEQNCLLTA